MGVVLGVIGACLMFALSYSRIGVIRRHLTATTSRAMSSARRSSAPAARGGQARPRVLALGLHLLRLVERLFERIKRYIDAQDEKPVGYVVLDFSRCQGSIPRRC